MIRQKIFDDFSNKVNEVLSQSPAKDIEKNMRAMLQARLQVQVRTTRWMRITIGTMLIAMGIKVAVQTAVAIPAVTEIALTLRNYVVGFVHLNTLGAGTMVLLAFALERRWIDEARSITRIGLVLLIAGFALSSSV